MYNAGFKDILTLTRFPVTLAVTFTAFTAMLLFAGEYSNEMLWPIFGIFLLAAGASAFNQYQEWPYDEKMERTRRRPIPSRRISPAEGLRIALIGIGGGLVILMYESNWLCFVLGIFNLLWYNGLYTSLKRVTAFAVVPGALTGSIPVFMGWAAMKGDIFDPLVVFLAFFVFIWQMPHFWMLMLKYGNEYRNAGFPVLTDIFSPFQIKAIVMFWIIASSTVSMMFVFFNVIQLRYIGFGMLGVNIVLVLLMIWQFYLAKQMNYRMIFMSANFYILAILLLIIADHLIR